MASADSNSIRHPFAFSKLGNNAKSKLKQPAAEYLGFCVINVSGRGARLVQRFVSSRRRTESVCFTFINICTSIQTTMADD